MLNREKIIIIVLIVSGFLSCRYHQKPKYDEQSYGLEFDRNAEPIQLNNIKKESIDVFKKKASVKINFISSYNAFVKIKGKKNYFDSEAWFAPTDLIFVWGKLVDIELDKFISYGQAGRWYYYRYKQGTPVSRSYIINHSANTHIIPASDNIKRAVDSLQVGDFALFEGYLVNAEASYEGRAYTKVSSLRRSDEGAGSCEVFYVEKVRLGDKIYE